jgi:hypothetical protein
MDGRKETQAIEPYSLKLLGANNNANEHLITDINIDYHVYHTLGYNITMCIYTVQQLRLQNWHIQYMSVV